jgi:hypothetical protein
MSGRQTVGAEEKERATSEGQIVDEAFRRARSERMRSRRSAAVGESLIVHD